MAPRAKGQRRLGVRCAEEVVTTPDEVWRVQKSFAELTPVAEPVAERFYHNLLGLDWSLRLLFKGDLQRQGRKLMRMLAVVINDLDRVETILPALQNLARRHVVYGVRPPHYATVGAALLITLEQSLGPGFTPEVRQAWVAMYDFVAGIMKDAAYPDKPVQVAAG